LRPGLDVVSRQRGAQIRLYEVSKTFGSVRAVDRVNLTIGAGEFVTLLGPSGSGKTTLLNILAGFVAPDAGDVHVADRSVLRIPPYRRGLGIVFQNYALFPHMTVFENISFPLRMRGVERQRRGALVREALELVQLPNLELRFPHQLSGGQQQRVAFARAVVFDPQVLLMDEPLGALDKNLRQQLQVELRRLHRQLGVTVVYVTHDQEEALAMSDRIAVMDHGRIIQIGSGRDLYEHPRNEFVARFFGESNFLDGHIVVVDGDRARARIDGLTLVLEHQPTLASGARVRIFIRPDRIRLARPGEPAHEARIEEATYLGETVRVLLRLHAGPRLVARLPSSGSSVRENGEVRVTWDANDLRVLFSDVTAGIEDRDGRDVANIRRGGQDR
jgi:putative spermidine/putrescine transport system ATP-binding protein